MEIPLGRILEVDLGIDKWGMTLYLVIKPTLICDICGERINNWRKDENGYIECSNCEDFTTQQYLPCPYCKDNDLMRLRVIQNNNWGIDNDGHLTQLNDKVGKGLNICKKELQKEIKSGKIRLLSAKQSVDKKRLIEWSMRIDYDPSKEMPQDIIDYWKYENQK